MYIKREDEDRQVRLTAWPQMAVRCVQSYRHSMPSTRRFRPPWVIDEHPESFIVRDATGQALAYFYFEDEPGRRSAANLLTRDGARRMAVNRSASKLDPSRCWLGRRRSMAVSRVDARELGIERPQVGVDIH
jgi:hypothetical protein